MSEQSQAKGIFYVNKKRLIAQFGYGPGMSYTSQEEAEQAAISYVGNRKDKDSLSIVHHDHWRK